MAVKLSELTIELGDKGGRLVELYPPSPELATLDVPAGGSILGGESFLNARLGPHRVM
jgi:hypothetical protein